MHNNYPHQIKETFHTRREREGGNSISIISSIRKELGFIKKGRNAQQNQGVHRYVSGLRGRLALVLRWSQPRAASQPGSASPCSVCFLSSSPDPPLHFLGRFFSGGCSPPARTPGREGDGGVQGHRRCHSPADPRGVGTQHLTRVCFVVLIRRGLLMLIINSKKKKT